ncbi:CRISPR-associated endonuclease Cas1 [Thomasclavelia sp.]|uniref:CRISPR-associated endonuclease Cas1 n=1 Tax=Thomasclavelia sp. TaxID=3025757 RepID=UPI0025CD204C|nr:CRISPR-associated endonuclease Cas1 [Thomasclavelia sp.]
MFSGNLYSFQKGIGILDLLKEATISIDDGKEYVVEVDIKSYFENINHDVLEKQLLSIFQDKNFVDLIMIFHKCSIIKDGLTRKNKKGLITGSSLGPILSNLYLYSLDKDYKYLRYCDNIYYFVNDENDGVLFIEEIIKRLQDEYHLSINHKKTSISHYLQKQILGYHFEIEDKQVKVIKNLPSDVIKYYNWNSVVIYKEDNVYHILNDGILCRRDYSVLFENNSQKNDIPVEIVDNINVYSNIIFSTNFFKIMNEKEVRVSIYDSYDNLVGDFIPKNYHKSASVLVNQVSEYIDQNRRLDLAKKIIIAGTHNILSNLRYYKKQLKNNLLDDYINRIEKSSEAMKDAKNNQELLLEEARMRECYYSSFNLLLKNNDFKFIKRTRRPPEDSLNAMISLGNTLLYQIIATEIYKTKLDIRISYLHSSLRRYENLNLDIAEIFKPIIVDKLIFKLVNKHIIDSKLHFTKKGKSVLLNKEGKRIFITQLNKKLYSKIKIKDTKYTYYQLINEEIMKILRYFKTQQEYVPYKYRM